MARVALFIFILAIWIYAIIDCARTPSTSMPGKLRKVHWMALVIIAPVLGSIIWIAMIYRQRHPQNELSVPTPSGSGKQTRRPSSTPQRPIAPDDDPEFLRKLEARAKFEEWEREHRRDTSSDSSDTDPSSQQN